MTQHPQYNYSLNTNTQNNTFQKTKASMEPLDTKSLIVEPDSEEPSHARSQITTSHCTLSHGTFACQILNCRTTMEPSHARSEITTTYRTPRHKNQQCEINNVRTLFFFSSISVSFQAILCFLFVAINLLEREVNSKTFSMKATRFDRSKHVQEYSYAGDE